MAKQFKIPAEMRTDVGKGASRRLRRAGRVPAVVYGAGRDPAIITIEHDPLLHMAEQEAFHSSILELSVGKDTRQKVVLRDLQRHPFKPLLTHLDFLRVSDDQLVRINVPIHFINEDQSKAGRKAGVVISHQTVEVEIDALPKDLPEYLEVDLVDMEPGDSVMLSEIKLPEGVTIPALEISSDNDHPIVTALFPFRESSDTGRTGCREPTPPVGEAAEVRNRRRVLEEAEGLKRRRRGEESSIDAGEEDGPRSRPKEGRTGVVA